MQFNLYQIYYLCLPDNKYLEVVKKMESVISLAEFISLIGIALVFIVGIINILITVHGDYQNGVTKNRVQWIENIRKISSKIMAYDYTNDLSNEILYKMNEEMIKNINILSMYLNPIGSLDSLINIQLNKMLKFLRIDNSYNKKQNFSKARSLFICSMVVYMKSEWERVKWESKFFKLPFRNKSKLENERIQSILSTFKDNDSMDKVKLEFKRIQCDKEITWLNYPETCYSKLSNKISSKQDTDSVIKEE